jgi:DNA replication protein DnaC
MIDQTTLERLKVMRLAGMADALVELLAMTDKPLPTSEVIKIAVDREWDRRQDSKEHKLRRAAGFAQPHADIADLRVVKGRDMDVDLIRNLAVGQYLSRHQDVILQGPTGAGKTFVACALGNKATSQHKTVRYLRAGELFDQISAAEKTGTRADLLTRLVKLDLLIIDDWFLARPTRDQVQHLHALIDRRTKVGSTIFCTQLSADQWHDRIEEKVFADAIVDRITTNAHATVIHCADSMRRLISDAPGEPQA